ncbi:glycosyltransferase family 39 protein [Candidatus Woesearchaeota archaeon]|nr:glycosyltransferase family 39 protein [Candidatus Woesearchaeota archaeon]
MKQTKNLFPLVFILAAVSRILLLFHKTPLRWDSAVYIEMGKYIWSFGRSGLFESLRPPLYPLLIGFFLKLGSSLFFLRIIDMLFAVGCIWLTYLLGKEIYNRKVGTLAALLFSFSPLVLFWNGEIMSSIPSTFLALLSVYLFVRKSYNSAGFFLGLSFLTRFPQLLILPIFFVVLLLNKKIKKIFWLLMVFFLTISPYLVFNTIRYKNPLEPFFVGDFVVKNDEIAWFHRSNSYYLSGLFNDNYLILFFTIGLIILIFSTEMKKKIPAAVAALFILYFFTHIHKEMRFMLVVLPYIYLVSAHGIIGMFSFVKNRKVSYFIWVTLVVVALIPSYTYIRNIPPKDDSMTLAQVFLRENSCSSLWISNPVQILYSSQKADELLYYPVFNLEKITDLRKKLDIPDCIILNECDFPCIPEENSCQDEKEMLINSIEESFNERTAAGKCADRIFTRKVI